MRPWLGDFTWALPSIGVIGTWVTFGLCMVLFVAGVQKIPLELYDAARVDGAGAVREFFAVTLPGLRNEVLVAFVLTTINALRSFDIVYNTTAGGPGNKTIVPSMYMYQNAFLFNRVGYAAAIATLLAIAIFVLAAIMLRIGDRAEDAMTAGRLDRVGDLLRAERVRGDRDLPDRSRSCSSPCTRRRTS